MRLIVDEKQTSFLPIVRQGSYRWKWQYNQRSLNVPETKTGPCERVGFIDVSDINARKNISSPTIPPMTSPSYPHGHQFTNSWSVSGDSSDLSKIRNAMNQLESNFLALEQGGMISDVDLHAAV